MAISAEWLAGFFDGEGSINISCSSTSVLTVKLCIVNTHLPTLLRIHKELGGSLYARSAREKHHLPSYSLSWHGNRATKAIAELIAPHVIVKKEQIDFLLNEWFPYAEANKKNTTRGKKYGPEVWEFKKQMVSKLKDIRTIRYENNLLH